MAIQTMGLDYSWLINLADIIAKARQQPSAPKETPGLSTPGFIERFKAEEKEKAGLEREEKLLRDKFAHETELKKMELESKEATALAQALSKERIAGVGAEAGTEQARIAGAATVGAAQKTPIERGYELVDMLMSADEDTANAIIAELEARDEAYRQQQGVRPPSTISSGGVTIPIGGEGEVTGDPNNPLRDLEAIGAYTPGGGAPRPKATGAAAKPDIEQFKDLIEDMFVNNPDYMTAIYTGKGWDVIKDRMRTVGEEAGFGEETINSVIAMWEALVPEYEEEEEKEGEPGPLTKAWGGVKEAVTPQVLSSKV